MSVATSDSTASPVSGASPEPSTTLSRPAVIDFESSRMQSRLSVMILATHGRSAPLLVPTRADVNLRSRCHYCPSCPPTRVKTAITHPVSVIRPARRSKTSHVARIIVLGGVLALAMTGCGSDDKPAPAVPQPPPAATTTTAQPDDTRVAKRAVLSLNDFPAGWAESDDEPSKPTDCPGGKSARSAASARAVSKGFSHDDSIVYSAVYVYADEEAAGAAFTSLTSTEQRRCLARAYRERIVEDVKDGVTVGDIQTSALNIDPIGAESTASRFVIPASQSGFDIEATVDELCIREGRAVVLLQLLENPGVFDDELRASLASRAVRRARDAL